MHLKIKNNIQQHACTGKPFQSNAECLFNVMSVQIKQQSFTVSVQVSSNRVGQYGLETCFSCQMNLDIIKLILDVFMQ